MSAEEWRVVPGYDGAYEVSDLGRARSWKTHGNTRVQRAREPHILKTSISNGYPAVRFSEPGAFTHRRVHRLVMELFVGPCPDGMEVAHCDGDSQNAALSNLRYATSSENARDKILHGTTNRGQRHNMAKITEAEAIEIIRRLDLREGTASIAKDFAIGQKHVAQIARGVRWGHLTADLEARAKATTMCPNGHPRTPENLAVTVENGYEIKRCRSCQRVSWAAYRERKRQAAA